MDRYRKHALKEFDIAGWLNDEGDFDDETQAAICNHVLDLLDVFGDEGHSGSSAPYALGLFNKLAKFEPITPLTGKDSEWVYVGNNMYQNNRKSAVFKTGKNGRPYFIDAYVLEWEDDPGNAWSGGGMELTDGTTLGLAFIKDFKNMPTITVPIPVVSTGEKDSDWDWVPVGRERFAEVEEYYDLEFVKK